MENLELEDLNQLSIKTYEQMLEELSLYSELPGLDNFEEETCLSYIQNTVKCKNLSSEETYRAIMNFYKKNILMRNNGVLNSNTITGSLAFTTNGVNESYFVDRSKNDLRDALINQAGDVNEITRAFKGIYEKGNIENVKELNKAKEAFNVVVQKGLNKEQIRLRLLAEERAITEQLVKEGKKSAKERDNFMIDEAKKELTKNYGFLRDLERINSPYDKLFNISIQIADLERENNKINNNPNSSDLDFKQYDVNENRIYELEEKLAKEMSKFDPRIVEDAINDKIASAELELEIDQIKKGKEVNKEAGRAMPKEIVDLKNDLLAVRKQVKNDIKIVEQNTEHNV